MVSIEIARQAPVAGLGWRHVSAGILVLGYFLASAFLSPVNIQDEGFAVYGATRVLNGEIPYRDFLIEYPPGIFYLLASVFKIFGTSLLVERMCDAVTRTIIVVLVYSIAGKISSPR